MEEVACNVVTRNVVEEKAKLVIAKIMEPEALSKCQEAFGSCLYCTGVVTRKLYFNGVYLPSDATNIKLGICDSCFLCGKQNRHDLWCNLWSDLIDECRINTLVIWDYGYEIRLPFTLNLKQEIIIKDSDLYTFHAQISVIFRQLALRSYWIASS